MGEVKFTPGALRLADKNRCIVMTDKSEVADTSWGARDLDECAANAARIVHVWNCHDDLVKALDKLLNWPARFSGSERAEDVAFARAALTKASG